MALAIAGSPDIANVCNFRFSAGSVKVCSMAAQILHKKEVFRFYLPDFSTNALVPYFPCGVAAGFPSPADDYQDGYLDLNKLLIPNPAATIIGQADGDSMVDCGIFPWDYLIINRSLSAVHDDVIVGVINGEFTLKRLKMIQGAPWLYPENRVKDYQPIRITGEMSFEVWGVVADSIRRHRRNRQ
jgi:DNA polymerase V